MSRFVSALMTVALVGSLQAEQLPRVTALEANIETTYVMASGQEVTVKSKYYRSSDGRVCEESPVGRLITDPVSRQIIITRRATEEARVFDAASAPKQLPPDSPTDLTPIGESMVDGLRVTKMRSGKEGATREFWTAKEIGLVVYSRVEGPTLSVTRVTRDIVLREPSGEVFRVPGNYRIEQAEAPVLNREK
jgi:hypothetical protein